MSKLLSKIKAMDADKIKMSDIKELVQEAESLMRQRGQALDLSEIRGFSDDLDGCVLDKDKNIHPFTLMVMRWLEAIGIPSMFNSGRSPRSIMPYSKGKGFFCYNGSQFYTDNAEVEKIYALTKEQISLVSGVCHEMGLRHQIYDDTGFILIEKPDPVLEGQEPDVRPMVDGKPVQGAVFVYVGDIVAYVNADNNPTNSSPKLLGRLAPEQIGVFDIEEFSSRLEKAGANVDVSMSAKDTIEVVPHGAGKGRSVHAMAESIGCTAHNISTTGDGTNDLAMHRETPFSMSPANGMDAVKKEVTYVTEEETSLGVGVFKSVVLLAHLAKRGDLNEIRRFVKNAQAIL